MNEFKNEFEQRIAGKKLHTEFRFVVIESESDAPDDLAMRLDGCKQCMESALGQLIAQDANVAMAVLGALKYAAKVDKQTDAGATFDFKRLNHN